LASLCGTGTVEPFNTLEIGIGLVGDPALNGRPLPGALPVAHRRATARVEPFNTSWQRGMAQAPASLQTSAGVERFNSHA
jgi:hypothetical protein